MFCNNCGNELRDNAKFCNKCGTPVEGTTNNSQQQASNSTGAASAKAKKWFQECIDLTCTLLKKPTIPSNEIKGYIDTPGLIIYNIVLIFIASVLSLFTINIVIGRMVSSLNGFSNPLYSMTGYLWGEIAHSVDIGISYIFFSILSSVLLIGILTGLALLLYKMIFKYELSWRACIRLMTMPVLIRSCGSLLVLITAIISSQLAILLYIAVMFMFSIFIVMQYIIHLDTKPKVIYTVPAVYLTGVIIQLYISSKFIS